MFSNCKSLPQSTIVPNLCIPLRAHLGLEVVDVLKLEHDGDVHDVAQEDEDVERSEPGRRGEEGFSVVECGGKMR